MDDIENLEKLAELKKKSVITEEEYTALKTAILDKHMQSGNKSGLAYVLLAGFLGGFGVHNFYAGYTKRAVAQLLMTLFSWILLFIPWLIVQVWVLLDICLINKDARGIPFNGDKALILIIRIVIVAMYALGAFGFFLALLLPMLA